MVVFFLKLISKLLSWLSSGGYDKEEKAARAYDLAALKYWGPTATTNFPVRVTSLCIMLLILS